MTGQFQPTEDIAPPAADAMESAEDSAASDGGLYASRDWLRSVEGTFATEHAYRESYSNGRLRGRLAAYRLDRPTFPFLDPVAIACGTAWAETIGAHLHADEVEQFRASVAGLTATTQGHYPSAVCVAPFGYAPALTHGGNPEAASTLVDEFDDIARGWHARSRAVLYVADDDQTLRTALSDRGAASAILSARATLAIRGSSFDGYVASLSPNRRRSARRELAALRASGVQSRIEGADYLTRHAAELAVLSAAALRRYGHAYEPKHEQGVLEHIAATLAPLIRVVVVSSGGRPTAFAILYEFGDRLYAAFAGKAEGADRFVHFEACYYAPIRYAIRSGLRSIDFGPEALQAKIWRGCDLLPLHGYFQFDTVPRAALISALELQSLAHRRRLSRLRAVDRHGPPNSGPPPPRPDAEVAQPGRAPR